MNKNTRYLFFVASIAASFATFAQEDASRIQKRFETTPEPKSTLQPLVFPINERTPPEEAGRIKFVLKSLTIKGNTAFSLEQLAPHYADYIGKEVTLLDVYKLRDAITAKYGNAGFGLSKAIIPEQRIQSDGLVQIDIIEGFVDEVILEGSTEGQQEFFAHASEQIKSERPLNARTLERYLLLANDRFAIKVTSTLKSSEKTPAASTLILKIDQAPKLEGSGSLDNRGTQLVGPNQINLNTTINGLGNRASQTAIGYATTSQTSELQYFSLGHTEIISQEGTSLNLGWVKSLSKPGSEYLRLLNNNSDSETWSLKLAHPIIRTRQENLTVQVRYDQQDTKSETLDVLTMQDRIRALRLGLNYDNADSFNGVNQALIQYSYGIQGLGATDSNNLIKSRADGKAGFQKITANLSRTQELAAISPLLSKFSIYTALMGQYSPTGLLSSEECGIGGQQFGRAYNPSEIIGDSCLAGNLELRFTPSTEGTFFKYAQFYGWYDGGTTTNHTPLSASDHATKSLSSTGLGVRYGMGGGVTGYIEAAQPISRDVLAEGNKNPRFFASLSVRF